MNLLVIGNGGREHALALKLLKSKCVQKVRNTPFEGIVDAFEAEGLKIFGPSQSASRLEGSKSFAKHLMKKYHIPTAAFENYFELEEALDSLKNRIFPIFEGISDCD